jgi:TPR repeat protein
MFSMKAFVRSAFLLVAVSVASAAWAQDEDLLRRAKAGNAEAQTALGDTYWSGDEEHYVEAVKWYRLAAEQGDAGAQLSLGVMYDNGEGVAKDDAEAVKWYRLAAEQGNASAQSNLGMMYDNGEGVAKNDAEAVKWYRKAAEQGHAMAQSTLGTRYMNGEGIAENYVLGHMWMNLSRAQGNKTASENMKILVSRMTEEQIDKAQGLATEWQEKRRSSGGE